MFKRQKAISGATVDKANKINYVNMRRLDHWCALQPRKEAENMNPEVSEL